jgi:D-alanyl-lipoteichoic acid acyltransferase DltB (MBOAT superfamily)
MLFNSFEFFLFVPVVFTLYWFFFNKSLTLQNLLLLIASCFFYGWFSWKFLILLIACIFLDFLYGFGVNSTNKRKSKTYLILSVLNNLSILFVFKYYDFFAVEFQRTFELVGIHLNISLLNIALPVGVSFYTFHGMSYVFDIYRGIRKPVSNFIEYAVFVAFFPLLVAGPIERANHLLPQVQSKRIFKYQQAVEGCRLILWGMFKKVVIADSLALIVDDIFDHYPHHSSLTLILAAIGFSFQIYCDFSGYSDIAIGTGKLFGFELLSNFRFPYFSRDIAEFWRRWHISLSSWFKDYLYIPLGGSKNGKLIAIRNTIIIFFVSGFWHGASWNYLVWGGIHAMAFLPLLISNKNRKHVNEIVANDGKLPTWTELLQILSTFAFVTFAWIFFRMHSLTSALDYIKSIFTNFNNLKEVLIYRWIVFYVLIVLIADWYFRKDERVLKIPKLPRLIRIVVYAAITILIFSLLAKMPKQSFIYFQF